MTKLQQLKEGPYRLSAVYHRQLSLGATFERDKEGWIVAERFTVPEEEARNAASGIGLSDLSPVSKVHLTGDGVAEAIHKELGEARMQSHMAFVANSELFKDTLVCPLTDTETLLLSRKPNLEGRISLAQVESRCFHTLNLTSYFAGLYLVGPRSRDVLSKLTDVNVNEDVFPNLTISQLPIFHVLSIMVRFDILGLLGYQIYFDRGFGEYLWDGITHAGKEFGIAPIGSSALKLLGWE